MADSDTSRESMARDRARRLADPGGTWPTKRRLAEALRRLIDRLCSTAAPEANLIEATDWATRTAALFEAAGDVEEAQAASLYSGMHDFGDRGPVCGLSNPIAPPMKTESDPESQSASATVTFGHAYEGAPGCVHGGFVAAAFDEILGMVSSYAGRAAMTGEFTVRYRRPTPVGVPLRIEARFDEHRGRRIHTSADLFQGDIRLADARGLFIVIPDDRFAQLEREFSERQNQD
ncbi:PaaI family thioesterase [Myxococcota bacterium]|nr:PaaI family thioesterase [Myxococcota bacterium]